MRIRDCIPALFLCLAVLLPMSTVAPAYAAEPAAPVQTALPADAAEPADAEATGETADTAAAEPAGPLAAVEDRTLVADGLLAQVFSLFDDWLDSLSGQLREAASAIGDIRLLGQWWQTAFDSPEEKRDALRGMSILAGILAIALLAEFIVHRLLRRLRERLARHAAQRHREFEERESVDEATVLVAAGAAVRPAEPIGNIPPDEASVHEAAGLQPPEPAPATSVAGILRERRAAIRNWSLLGRLPYALADALLALLPLAAFFGLIAVLMSTQRGVTSYFYAASLPIINAYIGVRIALCLVRLMASPAGQGLRLIHMSDSTAHYLYRWAMAIFTVAAFGVGLGEAAVQLGAGNNIRTLAAKLASLVAHIMLIVVVIQTRRDVQSAIRGRNGNLAPLRSFLAEIWPAVAVLGIAAFWVVWALSVANGFQRALSVAAITAAVLVVSRIAWIVVVGALDKSFEHANAHVEAVLPGSVSRYRTVLRYLINIVFAIGTIVALLEAWGVDALGWFAPGTVGRRLASASLTILIAATFAVIVWETISLALRRRIQRWTENGDAVRAARLRTLVPMIRTLVLIVIALIVILTALSELGINIAPLLAGASIIGVALGFGSQKLVQDFITGIFLLMENAMQVGDNVTVAGVSGTVEYLSIRTVKLRAGDGSLHVVPFSSVTTVNNVNRGVGNAAVRINVRQDSDLDLVFATLRKIGADMRADPAFSALILEDLSLWGVDQIDGSMATIAGQIRTTDKGRWPVQREFNRRVLQVFSERGIALANPKETLVTPISIPSGDAVVADGSKA